MDVVLELRKLGRYSKYVELYLNNLNFDKNRKIRKRGLF